jgi:hypothetical protein
MAEGFLLELVSKHLILDGALATNKCTGRIILASSGGDG